MDALNTTTMLDEPADAEPRRSKIAPAARWVTIDYRSIVEGTVAGLAENTPDARSDVYAQARTVVHRHLQLMRLPDPVVEMEKLALDLTIRKIEREARAAEALAAPPGQADEPAGTPAQPTAIDSLRALGTALGEVSRALVALLAGLGVPRFLHGTRGLFGGTRQLFRSTGVSRTPQVSRNTRASRSIRTSRSTPAAATPLRVIGKAVVSPVGLAAGLPITALLAVTIYLVDSDTGFDSTISMKAAQFLERVDVWLHGSSTWAGIGTAGKDEERIETASVQPARDGPARARVIASQSQIASASDADGAGRARRPASGRSSGSAAETTSGVPRWFTGYANLVEAGPPLTRPNRRTDAALEEQAAAPAEETAPPAEQVAAATAGSAPAETTASLSGANSLAALPEDHPLITLTPLRNPSPKAAALIDAGKKAALGDDLERAVQDFTEAARIDPNHPSAYTERGQALFKLGETDRAIADYTAALKRDANFGPALRGRAMANLYRGSTEIALADLGKAIQIAEVDPARLPPLELFYARRSRANIYGTKNRPDGEVADCTALIDSYKRDKALKSALIEVYQPDGAANLVASIYRQRANAYIRLSKPDLARDDLTSAVLLSSDRGFSALLDRARLNEAMGQRDQAIADLQAALNIRPSSEEARIALRRISSGPAPGRGPGRT